MSMPKIKKKTKDYRGNIELFRSSMTNQQYVSPTVIHWCRSVATAENISETQWDTAITLLSMTRTQQANCVIINDTIVPANTNRETWQYSTGRGWQGFNNKGERITLLK